MLNENSSPEPETSGEEEIHRSDPATFKETLGKLSKPLPPGKIRSRPGHKNESGGRIDLDYAPWYEVADVLDQDAPNWSHSVKDIQTIGQFVTITVAITIDGITREGVGTGTALSETGIKKAEHDALKRAAVKFGIARDLYRKESTHIDRDAARFERPHFDIENPPRPFKATSTRDALSGKQMSLIQSKGRELEIDVDADCQAMLDGCKVSELNRKGASWFIDYLMEQERGMRQADDSTRQMNNVASFNTVSPETRAKLITENGGVSVKDGTYIVLDTIGGKDCKFVVAKSADIITCECGEYKTAANVNNNPGYECAHKIAVRIFKTK